MIENLKIFKNEVFYYECEKSSEWYPFNRLATKVVWEYFVISTQWQDLEYFQISIQTTS